MEVYRLASASYAGRRLESGCYFLVLFFPLAVKESKDPALLCWIWRSIDLLLPLMQADGLSQVAMYAL